MLTLGDAAKNKNVSVIYVQYLILIISICVGFASIASSNELNPFEKPITISFTQSELSIVLEEISNNTGVQIFYSEGVSDLIVSGQYSDKPFEELVRLLLRGVNHSLIFDKENKKLWIKDFVGKVYTPTTLEETGLTSVEMNKIYKDNLAIFQNKVSNKDRFIEEAGITQGELEKSYKNYLAKYNETLIDDNHLIPEAGISHNDLVKIYDEHIIEIEKYEADDPSIATEFGITQGELRKSYGEQLEKINQLEKSGELFVEELGMTVWQYEVLYSQYVKDFERSLKQP